MNNMISNITHEFQKHDEKNTGYFPDLSFIKFLQLKENNYRYE